MKRLIKYPLAVLFALLLGYSQVFAYLDLPSPSIHNAGGADRALQTQAGASAFEIAMVGEVEEDVDRSILPDAAAPTILLQVLIEPISKQAHAPQYQHLALLPESYLRFRAIRL